MGKTAKPLLIISDNIEKDPLTTLIMNKVKGILNVVAVRAPGFGDRRKALLEDLALLTSGKVIDAEAGLSLNNIELNSLGQAHKVVVGKDTTRIISYANKKQVFARCEQLHRDLA